jgi:phospho-N-acetylmuramoyl-pentapeptide-transferase
MLYYLLYQVLQPSFSPLNVFRYITVRTAVASLTALFLCLVLGPWMTRKLRALQIGQYIREEGPERHQSKAGTPTMGGILIVIAIIVPTLLWANLTNVYVWIAMFAVAIFAAIGFLDDYNKVVRKRSLGLTGRTKILLQILTAFGVGIVLLIMRAEGTYSSELIMPFFKNVRPDLVMQPLLSNPYLVPVAILPFLAFLVLVIVGASNAVNLTDGLDGLAIGCVVIAGGAFTVLTYLTSHARFADYLDIQHMPAVGELTIFCGSIVGAAIGFLWYNAHPAEMFMGDVGSLALGGALGTVAVIIKQEILLIFVGGVFVLEAISVILQVASFQLTGKRIFKMAPIHHHFELIGWSESKIIVRFWIVAIVFALFALTTLKLR